MTDARQRTRAAVPAKFSVDVRAEAQRVLVCPCGELDLATAGDVEQEIVALLADGSTHVVVDLRGVTFLDSTGIRLILESERRARGGGARLSVIPGVDGARRPLEIARVLPLLDVLDD